MILYSANRRKSIADLIIADRIMAGFNAYFLIDVLHEALTTDMTEVDIDQFVDLVNTHYEHGTCSVAIDEGQMQSKQVKEEVLTNEIVHLYHIYKDSVVDLIAIYDIDLNDILDGYDSMFEVPREELCFIDYIQAHRWFSAAINFHLGLLSRSKINEQFLRVNADNTFAEYLTISEVEKLAGLITSDFVDIIENQNNTKLKPKIDLKNIKGAINELKTVT